MSHKINKINHPSINKFVEKSYEVRFEEKQKGKFSLNIFMKYVPGGSVKDLLDQYGSLHENIIKMYLV
jgi:serine/threonine protein kinase